MPGMPCQPEQSKMSQRILNTAKPTPAPTQRHHPSPPPKLGRRAASAAIAIAAAPALRAVSPASSRAQEVEPEAVGVAGAATAAATVAAPCLAELPVTATAFLDVSIGGEPAGRITVGLFGDAAPAAASRFLSLATGVGYRRKEFVKIVPGYVQHGGVVSYPAVSAVTDRLAAEADALRARCPGGAVHGAAGAVSIVVRDPSLPPPKPKLVARGGKLEVEEEQVGVAPNGTEFVITTGAAPELDASAVLVGRVLDGMDVVAKIAAVPTVRDNAASPYFR